MHLLASLEDKKYRVPLKKTYAVLSEALDLTFDYSDYSINETFGSTTWCLEMYNNLFSHLAVAKHCCGREGATWGTIQCINYYGDISGDCFAMPKSPDNVDKPISIPSSTGITFKLKDGVSVALMPTFLLLAGFQLISV